MAFKLPEMDHNVSKNETIAQNLAEWNELQVRVCSRTRADLLLYKIQRCDDGDEIRGALTPDYILANLTFPAFFTPYLARRSM